MKKRGVTILEVLVVLSIITLLTALITPVFKSAIREAKITRSMSNMKQLHQAIILYMGDSEDLTPGKALPPSMVAVINFPKRLPYELYHTGGRNMTSDSGRSDVYTYEPPRPDSEKPGILNWLNHVSKTNNNPILIVDETWSEPKSHHDVFMQKIAIGIFFDGQILRKHHYGYSGAYETWE